MRRPEDDLGRVLRPRNVDQCAGDVTGGDLAEAGSQRGEQLLLVLQGRTVTGAEPVGRPDADPDQFAA
ncbi:MAG: hypothetical protein V9G12_06490 [Microthrixaceae bacterium]